MTTSPQFKRVPVEATWAMQIAGRNAILSEDDSLDLSTDDARAAYRAMLASAPEPPADEVDTLRERVKELERLYRERTELAEAQRRRAEAAEAKLARAKVSG